MRLHPIMIRLLTVLIICTGLPPAPYVAHAASVEATSTPAAVSTFTLRSNMRIAAPPQLVEFPGACTPRDAIDTGSTQSNRVLLPLIMQGSTNVASSVQPVHQSAIAQPAIPLDPSRFATPLDEETSFAESIAFLYNGPDAVQTGVTADAIDPEQVAVLRGTVLAQNGQPLPGVKIQIFGHADYGQTISRADGQFDMVVNAGQVTVCFELPGHLPTQRLVQAAWHDFTTLEDVVLLPMDSVVSTIDLTDDSKIQVAQNTPTNDDDGMRQSTLLFEADTGAQMVMADGTTKPLTTLNVRATEYTVGENGPQAMPGELPPASGYTYAVEFTVDEALTAGAVDVQFDKPIINYVENFLNFPAGTPVPTGYYDRGRGAWVPAENGRVITILSLSNGVAILDVDGSGQAASPSQLTELGIDDAERRTIAELYRAGQSLWRVPIPHFTPWDHNWPYGPPDDAIPPDPPLPQPDDHDEDSCEQGGSIIECQNQTLGEAIAVAGTAFALNYRSNRVPARELGNRVTIPVTGNDVPASLKNVILETSIAGRQEIETFGTEPNQSVEFRWDGTDIFGRTVPQPRLLTVRLGYVYPAIYRTPGEEFQNSFARVGNAPITSNNVRQEITIWRTWGTHLQPQSWDARIQELGGWTLTPHHFFDVDAGILYRGDGTQSSSILNGGLLRTVAGVAPGGETIPLQEGAPATEVGIGVPIDVAAAPDGSFYFTSTTSCVYKVDRQGLIHFVTAHRGTICYDASDEPNNAMPFNTLGLALAPNGDLYVVNHGNNGRGGEIVRIRPDGSATSVAGNGQVGYSGDGGPATAAAFAAPMDVAIAPDGSFYVADFYNRAVRHVGLDGIITTVAGGGDPADGLGDGGPATDAQLGSVRSVAVDQDGVLYIGHANLAGKGIRVRRVGLDGTITTVVGGGTLLNQEDEMGTDISLTIPLYALAVGPDNNLYFNDGFRIRRLGQDGRLTTVAGTTVFGYSPDGTPVLDAKLAYPAIAFAPNGTLYLAEQNNLLVRSANLNGEAFNAEEAFVYSKTGAEIYVFTPAGRHLRTLNALTDAVLYTFGYDAADRLITVTDHDDNVTTIERSGNGTPTAIVGPHGQRTVLTVNDDGYLAAVTIPTNRTFSMNYHAATARGGGLLASFTTPQQATTTFVYDDNGRLLEDIGPAGRKWLLSQDGNTVTMTSGANRSIQYTTEQRSNVHKRQQSILPSGVQIARDLYASGTISVTMPDQSRVHMRTNPDPLWTGAIIPAEYSVETPGGVRFVQSNQRVVEIDDQNSAVQSLTDTRTINNQRYTSMYNVAERTVTSSTPLGRQSTIRFDAAGRITHQQHAGLAPTVYTYNEHGQLAALAFGEGSAARTFAIAYGANGEPQQLTNPLGEHTTLAVNEAGQLTGQTRPDGAVTTYGYDAGGNLTSLTPPGQSAHRFAYDIENRLTAYTPPDLGSGSTSTTYVYNADGQLTTLTRPDGSAINTQYDPGGRLAQLELGRGAIHYSYDNTSGRLAEILSPDGISLTYQYDGPLLTESRWRGSVQGVLQRTYDNWHRVTRMSVGNQVVSYTYNQDGQPVQVGALRLDYDENGLLTGSTLSNLTTASTRNQFGEETGSSAANGGNSLYSVTYTRDALGRITRKVEAIDGTTTTYEYAYDSAGRLREVNRDGSAVATYSYDANGNRLSGPGAVTGAYDAQDRMTSYDGATYTYNAAGDLTAKTDASGRTAYTYDELSNLFSVLLPDGRTIRYLLDGRNRRVGKLIDGALAQGWLYQDALNPVAELDAAGTVVSRFVYATRRNVPDYMVRNGVTYRIISDERGSPRLVVNASNGSIVQRIDYDAFGNVVQDTNPGFQPFGFAGGLYDPETALVRFGARDYDAQSGRWTTKDPSGLRGGVNLYTYAMGDPINYVDMRGRTPLPIPLTTTPGTAMSASGPGGPGGIGEAPVSGDFEEDIDTDVDERFHPFPDLPALPDWDEETVPEFEIPLIVVCALTETSEIAGSQEGGPNNLPEMTPLELLLQALLGAGIIATLGSGGMGAAPATTGAGEAMPWLLPALVP